MKRPVLAGLIVALIVPAVACNHGTKDGPPAAALPPAISVQEATVEPRPMPRDLTLTGSLISNQQSEVAANASGRVLRTYVERGSFVKEGAALVQLDSRSAELSQTEAMANLRNAKSALSLSNELCKRNQALFDKGAISKEEWERASSQCETSSGSAEAAQARAELAQKSYRDATVRAPFSGMIGERYVSVGEYVQPPTKVVSLVELDPLRLQLTVGESDLGQIHEGQEVSFEVNAYPHEMFKATIKYLDPRVRSSTRDMVVEATVANPDHRLRPGMFAVAHVQLKDEPIASVPKQSLVSAADTHRLYAVVEGRIEERIVQTGPERDGFVAVLDGVKTGEKVVVAPSEQVKDGVPVK